MVEAFFGFKKTPFTDSPDAKQLFASQAWNQVKARLQFLVEHHGAEDGLLGFITPWGLPTRELSRRGGERRYGRHPRLVSSNEGYAARQPGDRSPRPGCRGNDGSDCGAILATVWC